MGCAPSTRSPALADHVTLTWRLAAAPGEPVPWGMSLTADGAFSWTPQASDTFHVLAEVRGRYRSGYTPWVASEVTVVVDPVPGTPPQPGPTPPPPGPATDEPGWRAIVPGLNSTACGLARSGAVYCGGESTDGVGGPNVSDSDWSPTPARIPLPEAATLVTLADTLNERYTDARALVDSGAVYCWVDNTFGQLGEGPYTSTPTPVRVGLPAPAVWVSAGWRHTCAFLTTGDVYCWGSNDYWQVSGDLEFDSTWNTPMRVPLFDAVSVRAGRYESCAATVTAAVYCWGVGWFRNGMSLNGTVLPSPVPGISDVAAALDTGENNDCAVMRSGSVSCWGDNHSGELGDGTTTTSLTAVAVTTSTGMGPVATVGASVGRPCALTVAGAVYCWGGPWYGGYDPSPIGIPASVVPAPVAGLDLGVTSLSAGLIAFCAVRADGSAACIGGHQTAHPRVPDT